MDIVVYVSQESAGFVINRMSGIGMPCAEKCDVEVVAAFGFQGYVGIDGSSVSKQFAGHRQPYAVFVGCFDGQRFGHGISCSGSVTYIVPGGGALHFSGTCDTGLVGLSDVRVVDIIFYKEHIAHFSIKQQLVVRKGYDVFGHDIV